MNIICYLSNGYPTNKKTLENADNYVEGGCDIIEIDLPTDNPFLDNELIQKRMKTAYFMDKTLASHVDNLLQIREKYPKQKLLLLVYEHTVKKYGLKNFAEMALGLHLEAVILIAPEDSIIEDYLLKQGIKVAHFLPFDLPRHELEMAKKSKSFIYLQAKPSGPIKNGLNTLKKVIDYLRSEEDIRQPIYCGMGISTSEDIRMLVDAGAEGAFIGSSILKIEDKAKVLDYIKKLKNY